MKSITVFTRNEPRHLSLIESLCSIADVVYCVIEATTVFPGQQEDLFRSSDTMTTYFAKVRESEQTVFGLPRILPPNARPLVLKLHDVNNLSLETLDPVLHSDAYVVFGATYIKGELIDALVERRTYNIHMGTSPYYRGSSCNFWAAYDDNIDYVGATIHLLSKGLDSGDMLYHALPAPTDDPFLLGMHAVKAAHQSLKARLSDGSLSKMEPIKQDKADEIRYSRGKEFTDEVAQHYLNNLPSKEHILEKLNNRDLSRFHLPYIGS